MRTLIGTIALAAFGIFFLSFLMLNMWGGVVGGVWLAVLGEWLLIVYGVLLIIVMPWAWTIANLPGMWLAGLGFILIERSATSSRSFVALVGFVIAAWGAGLDVLWVYFVFVEFSAQIDQESAIPYLLWGYSTTMAPLGFMASKEQPATIGLSLGVLLAALAYGVLVFLYALDCPPRTMLVALGVLAVAEATFATAFGVAMMPKVDRPTSDNSFV